MIDDPIFFDFSKLKPNGYHYVAIRFKLPYLLNLPLTGYEFDIPINIDLETQKGSLLTQIILESRWDNKEKDFNNTYRYILAQVFIPVGSKNINKPSDFDSLWNQVFQTQKYYHDLAIDSVNLLLETYRFYTKKFYIKPLAGRDLRFDFDCVFLYNNNLPHAPTSNFTMKRKRIPFEDNIYPKFKGISEHTVTKIKSQIHSNQRIPLAETLLLNAYDYLDQGNYRLAIVEAETAFESAIHQHLQNFFKGNKNTLDKIREFKNFTDLIKSKLCRPAFKGKKFVDNTPEFDLWRQNVMDLRNSIVHGDKITVSEKEAHEAINTIENTLAFLIQRPPTFPIQN